MSNEFRGTGNVGDVPMLKKVVVGEDERMVSEMRVFFDDYRSDGQGGFVQTGGFWLDVNIWGSRRAADVTLHVKKGARVHVIGRLTQAHWIDRASGEYRQAFQLNADELFLGLSRIEDVQYKPRRELVAQSSEGRAP
jgi:single-stranded DNA-binding protein